MTNTELILNMLAEASTKDISQAIQPETFEESKKVAVKGGNVAKVAAKNSKQIQVKKSSPHLTPKLFVNKHLKIWNRSFTSFYGKEQLTIALT